ncbi:tuftelin 1a [Chanos chanos]|uniref:Tuftelin 1a n=1 Tax=Chanos chanos TaxID=29144 RepID=A0A6J2W2C2_CHACN|nr:tuftelin [Chanos chanos]
MNGSRSLCTIKEIRPDERAEGHRRLRLTLHDQDQRQPATASDYGKDKPIGRAFALVQPTNERQPYKFEPTKPTEEKVEVIKVYLEARKQEQTRREQNLKMLSDEVSQIQEVRYCLKTLREQMAAKTNNNKTELKVQFPANGYANRFRVNGIPVKDTEDKQELEDEQEREKMREASKRLYAQLQEAEKKHQEEREKLQAEASQYRQQLSEQTDRLKEVQQKADQQDQQIEELQRLLGGMEQESSLLREQLMTKEAELLRLTERKEEGQVERERLEELEKENAILKEKIHHLDDMLKSQQRKLRQMIEQLQNSRMVIQERDRVIRELEERVSFLEGENRELRDQVDYFMESQGTNSYVPMERNAQIVYSKPLRPTTHTNKSLPFIKVVEIKS